MIFKISKVKIESLFGAQRNVPVLTSKVPHAQKGRLVGHPVLRPGNWEWRRHEVCPQRVEPWAHAQGFLQVRDAGNSRPRERLSAASLATVSLLISTCQLLDQHLKAA